MLDARKALLAGYVSTYNNLDTLCWAIPTRVYAANFVVLGLVASGKADGTVKLHIAAIAFIALAAVNAMGASSLRRLWLDHSRMGFWLAALEEDMAPAILSRDQYVYGAEAKGKAAGYFTDRHREGFGSLEHWRKCVYERSQVRHLPLQVLRSWRGRSPWEAGKEQRRSLFPSLSARHTNILFMRLSAFGFCAAALASYRLASVI